MARYKIPKFAGQFFIKESKAGSPIVWNGKTSKAQVIIPCRDNEHAQEVLKKVQELKNGGEI